MIAAGQAAIGGAQVTLLEKMSRTGLKLGITGKGRCNLTNSCSVNDFISHFGREGLFLRQAFARFFNTDLIDFFTSLDIELVEERGGRVFPKNGSAIEIRNCLYHWLKANNVEVLQSSPVKRISIKNNSVTGVFTENKLFPADRVILASGGSSYPQTGSTGDGYRMSQQLGHTITPVRPALVPLTLNSPYLEKLAGLKLKNVQTKLCINNNEDATHFGEIFFTDFGVSGPGVLTLSGKAVDHLDAGSDVTLKIDFKPALTEKQLGIRVQREADSLGKKQIKSLLKKIVPIALIDIILQETDIPITRKNALLNSSEKKRIVALLKKFQVKVSGYRPFSEAIITAGGIDLNQVNPKTMESKIVQGLYFAGEILNLQADTGGYNLQAAFSTGWVAGNCAATDK